MFRDERDAIGYVDVLAVESVGSSRGFFLSGKARLKTILAMYGCELQDK